MNVGTALVFLMIEVGESLGSRFNMMVESAETAPSEWSKSCVHTEVSLHQLSPYIGKLKSTIAKELINSYTKVGDLIVDPFCGAGTIPLEGLIAGRNVFAADASPYARVLAKAKLFAPEAVEDAIQTAERLLFRAKCEPKPDLRSVPVWIREFFHPETLREAIQFAQVCRQRQESFVFACFLGILHHQRPGFLSYPSSHLVPYLRNNKYPQDQHPEMYEYRALKPRLLAKIRRAYARPSPLNLGVHGRAEFRLSRIENLTLPDGVDSIITSPPYMNALDYGRDNRLRLWFVNPEFRRDLDRENTSSVARFEKIAASLVRKADRALPTGKYLVLVVGESVRKNGAHPSQTIYNVIKDIGARFTLDEVVADVIPDIRRARKNCRSVKREFVLVFRKR